MWPDLFRPMVPMRTIVQSGAARPLGRSGVPSSFHLLRYRSILWVDVPARGFERLIFGSLDLLGGERMRTCDRFCCCRRNLFALPASRREVLSSVRQWVLSVLRQLQCLPRPSRSVPLAFLLNRFASGSRQLLFVLPLAIHYTRHITQVRPWVTSASWSRRTAAFA